MSSADPSSSPYPLGLDSVGLGTLYCLTGAVVYTAANMCLRALAGDSCQPWVICVKESVTVLVVAPWLIYQTLRGQPIWPTGRAMAALSLVGLAVQVIANVGVLWAMELVGLCITIPAVMGVNLIFSALFGWIFLREGVSVRTWTAITMLIAAIVLLRLGVTNEGPDADASAWKLGAALGTCCLAGIIYAALAVTIRRTVTGTLPPTTVIFWITAMGVISLAPLSYWHLGFTGILATPPRQMGLMLLAGVLNLIAFFSLTKGLQLATVVRANLISSTQVAMAALAGMVSFQEKPTPVVFVGIVLTMAGVIFVGQPKPLVSRSEASESP